MQSRENFLIYKLQDNQESDFVVPLISFQEIYRFPNGYGASVIQGDYAKTFRTDEYEVAVIKFFENEHSLDPVWDFYIVYDTFLTDDTLGYRKWDEVLVILEEIKNL